MNNLFTHVLLRVWIVLFALFPQLSAYTCKCLCMRVHTDDTVCIHACMYMYVRTSDPPNHMYINYLHVLEHVFNNYCYIPYVTATSVTSYEVTLHPLMSSCITQNAW